MRGGSFLAICVLTIIPTPSFHLFVGSARRWGITAVFIFRVILLIFVNDLAAYFLALQIAVLQIAQRKCGKAAHSLCQSLNLEKHGLKIAFDERYKFEDALVLLYFSVSTHMLQGSSAGLQLLDNCLDFLLLSFKTAVEAGNDFDERKDNLIAEFYASVQHA
jgi:hypothetical protein